MSVTRFGARSRAGDPVTGLLAFTRLESDTAVLAMLHVVRDRASGPPPPRGGPVAAEAPLTLDVTTEAQAIIRAGLTRDESAGLEIHQTLPDAFPRELLFPGCQIVAVADRAVYDGRRQQTPRGSPVRPDAFLVDVRGSRVDRAAGNAVRVLRAGAIAADHLPRRRVCQLDISHATQRRSAGASLGRDGAPAAGLRAGADALTRRRRPSVSRVAGEARLSGGGGSAGGTNDAAAQARFYTTLAPETMLNAYIPQMTAAGWTLETRSSGPVGTTMGRFITKSRGGQPVTALIGFATLGPYLDALLVVSKSPSDTAAAADVNVFPDPARRAAARRRASLRGP